MASFIELTDSKSRKILVNLEEVTFIVPAKKSSDAKATVIHFTSSVYGADCSVDVAEDYETVKNFVVNANLLAKGI